MLITLPSRGVGSALAGLADRVDLVVDLLAEEVGGDLFVLVRGDALEGLLGDGEHPPGTPTQFGRAMAELGVRVILALSPQTKGRVERTAGTFQDRLITELRLAGATSVEQARAVLKQFLPKFNGRFGVPAKCPEPSFRPLQVDLPLEHILCFKHRRRVARDNTVKYQRHTLQLLPDSKRRSYAGTIVEVPEGLDGRLSLHHEGRIIASQEAPPVRHLSEAPMELPRLPPSRPQIPSSHQNLRLQLSNC